MERGGAREQIDGRIKLSRGREGDAERKRNGNGERTREISPERDKSVIDILPD